MLFPPFLAVHSLPLIIYVCVFYNSILCDLCEEFIAQVCKFLLL